MKTRETTHHDGSRPHFTERSLAQAALARVRLAERLGVETSPAVRALAEKAPVK